MFKKTGDSEVVKIIDPDETEQDDKRQNVLASSLEEAKKYTKDTSKEKQEI